MSFLNFYKKHTEGVITFLCWLLPVLALLVYYAIRGVYPFGNSTVLTGDLGRQYIDFFKYYRETLLHDPSAITYSFEKSLGGEMMGTWGYYLMSPFNLIFLIIPLKLFPVGIWMLVIGKISCASLAFGYVLQKKYKESNLAIVAFAFSYGLMSFITANMLNIIWMDGLVWLPLVIYGIEKLVHEKKPVMYILSLAILLISNYYIGYMVCIFSVLYFLYTKFIQEKPEESKVKPLTLFLQDSSRFIGSSILAALLGAFILVPTFYTLLGSKLGASGTKLTFDWLHNPLDFVSRFLLGSFDLDNIVIGYPNIFVGSLAFIGFFSFFFNKSIRKKEKVGVGILTTFMVLSLSVTALDLFWHAFQPPNWYPHRYAFLLSFMICYFGYQSFRTKTKYTMKELKWYPLTYVIFTAYTIFFIDNVNILEYFVMAIGIMLMLLLIALINLSKDPKKSVLVLLLVIVEIMINTTVNMFYFGYFKASTYDEIDSQMSQVTEWFENNESEDNFYRYEKTFSRSRDDSFSFNFKGISHFNSTLEQSSVEFFSDLGLFADGVVLDYFGGTLITDAFFGLDYYVELKETSTLNTLKNSVTPLPRWDIHLYDKVEETKDFIIYENPYALSFGFGLNDEFLTDEYRDRQYIELNNSLLSAIADEDVNAFTKEDMVYSNADGLVDSTKLTVKKKDKLSFNLNKDPDGAYYVYTPYYVSGDFKTYLLNKTEMPIYKVAGNKSRYTVLNAGGQTDYKFSFKEGGGGTMQLRPVVYTLNEDILETAIEKVRGNEFVMDSYTNTNVKGHTESTFNRDKMIFTIPYNKGWEVFVDGKEVETLTIYGTFLGINLTEGEHEIEMKYEQPFILEGLCVSVLALATLGVFVQVTRVKNSKKETL